MPATPKPIGSRRRKLFALAVMIMAGGQSFAAEPATTTKIKRVDQTVPALEVTPRTITSKAKIAESAKATTDSASAKPLPQLPASKSPAAKETASKDKSSRVIVIKNKPRTTTPAIVASDKTAKSTLELKPAAGPLFGRSKGRIFPKLFKPTEKEVEEVSKDNPNIPKPPSYIPRSPSYPKPAVITNPVPQNPVRGETWVPRNQVPLMTPGAGASPAAKPGVAKRPEVIDTAKPGPATQKITKAPAKSAEPSLREHIGRVSPKTAPSKSAVAEEPGSERTQIASRANPRPAQSRVGDISSETAAPTMRQAVDYVGLPTSPFRVRTDVQRMKPMIERTLQYFYDRPEIASGRSNWGMMHSIMVYGIDTKLKVGDKRYSTIAWIAGNNICRGQRLLTQGRNGLQAKSGVGLQGHQAQFLAVLSLCDVPPSYPLYAGDTKYSMRDLIEVEKQACKSGEELTFTLIGLSHYLDTDSVWIASDGQRWDFQRLIREELSQPIVGTACGGTHRLMGFAHALRKRRKEGKPIVGQWARAEHFLRDFIAYTYKLQNRDGSFSTNWYEGRGDNGDVDRKIQTTGHMVEFLLTVTPDSRLQDPRLISAVRFLLVALYNDPGHEWKIGPKGHALRSLAMYHERIFKSGQPWGNRTVAQQSTPDRSLR